MESTCATYVKLLLYIVFVSINTFILVSSFLYANHPWKMLFFLTVLNLITITYYFYSMIYYIIKSKIQKKVLEEYEDNLYFLFIRDTFFKYNFVYAMVVFTFFWTLMLLGPTFMAYENNLATHLFMIYLHGVVLLVLIIDLIFSKHSVVYINKKSDIIILVGLGFMYSILQLISKYIIKWNAYPFMENLDLKQILVMDFAVFILLINFYQIYIYIADKLETSRRMLIYKQTMNTSNHELERRPANSNTLELEN